ncbi:hypothetical protein FDP41_001975 [Naegleria fowleri]|uniref:EGF-like domain-containing protein n=1 Tax=Naegleria fowleri TaxID=5763 RepID=A0A6A5C005_NAEFO|nr:uncharacterized protein FDP41_001975 [Naegleria fowleri]KAF0978905.1 hypothetical protein FDP41_001975 [Naegleria fowleri]
MFKVDSGGGQFHSPSTTKINGSRFYHNRYFISNEEMKLKYSSFVLKHLLILMLGMSLVILMSCPTTTMVVHGQQIYSSPSKTEVSSIPLFPTDQSLPKSYAGNLPVRNGRDRLFYWYFESSDKTAQDLIVVLNGGPACYFAELLFMGNGVFSIEGDLVSGKATKVTLNSKSFHHFAHVLYIDSPLGTGFSQFSTTSSDVDSYAQSMFPGNPLREKSKFPGATKYVVQDIQDALLGFSTAFPNLSSLRLHIFALGYSAKVVPYLVQQNLPSAGNAKRLKISSVILGNPFVQPSLQYASYAKYGYISGLTMYRQFVEMNRQYEQCLTDVENGDYTRYDKECHGLIEGLLVNSGNVSPFNIREQTTQEYVQRQNLLNSYVNNNLFDMLKSLASIPSKVNIPHCSKKVNDLFHEEYHLDLPQELFPALLNEKSLIAPNYARSAVRFLVYSEQFNLVSNVFGVNEFLRQMLNWDGQVYFNNINSTIFRVGGLVTGRFKSYGGLTQVVLYNTNYIEGMQDNPNIGSTIYTNTNVDMVSSKFEMVRRFITRQGSDDNRDDRNNLCPDSDAICHSSVQYPCPNSCSNRGSCNLTTSSCDCSANFYDNDCSVARLRYSIDQLAQSVSFPNLFINGRDTIVFEIEIQERTSLLDIYLDVSRNGDFGTPFVFLNVSTRQDALSSRELKNLAMQQIGYNLLNGYKSTRSEAQASHAHYFFTRYKSFQFFNTSHEPKKVIDAQDVEILRNEFHTLAIVIYNSADMPVEFNVTLRAAPGSGKVQLAGIFFSLSVLMSMIVVFEIVLIYQRMNNRKLFMNTNAQRREDIPMRDVQRQGLLNSEQDDDEEEEETH